MNDKAASTAVMKADQKEFMGRVLSVAISAPPTNPDKRPPAKSIASLGGGRKPTAPMEQKSRISFIPASVQKAATTNASSSPGQAAMSNDDFRKMFLK